MNEKQINMIIEDNIKYLDQAKPHTQYKINYIKDYVNNWLKVATNSPQQTINFIDCMCNSGIYSNGYYCTSMEVLKLFIDYCQKFPNKTFNLFLNDNNKKRISILKEVISLFQINKFVNLNLIIDDVDVIEYFVKVNDYSYKFRNAFTILYVDPYNFGIDSLFHSIKSFVDKYYCELIYNFFSSDIKRNINNKSSQQKSIIIQKELTGIIDENYTKNIDMVDTINNVQREFKITRNIKYSFAYQFKTESKNVELYYIIFFTPHLKGLELLKESIWNVFNGEPSFNKVFYQNKDLNTIFDTKELLINYYSEKMFEELYEKFIGKEVSYVEISEYVLQKSMLNSRQIINYIIKPLANKGILLKEDIKGKRNYKEDFYIFKN